MDPVPVELPGPLLEALQRSNRALDLEKIAAAYRFASDAHAGQVRRSGEPYVTHLAAVATILADLLGSGVDETLIAAALLHDVVEDTRKSPRAAWSYEAPQPKMQQVDHWIGFWEDVRIE